MNEAVYIFSQVAELANESKDKELENTVKPLFDKYRPYYTFDQREAESAE
jgi:hypothetical protein